MRCAHSPSRCNGSTLQQSKYHHPIRRTDIHVTMRDHRRDEFIACAERIACARLTAAVQLLPEIASVEGMQRADAAVLGGPDDRVLRTVCRDAWRCARISERAGALGAWRCR